MNELELRELRQRKWRVNGNAARTLESLRSFMEQVGFCTLYPLRPPVLLPTFIGAFTGSEENLPTWQHAFKDPRAPEATELMVRLLREKTAFEANLFGETNFLVAADVFPFFYALVGDKDPRNTPKKNTKPKPGGVKLSPLAQDTFAAIQKNGPLSKTRLLEVLGQGLTAPAVDRALADLWSVLKITRVDYNPKEGAYWDVLYRWAPEAVKEGVRLSVNEGLSALIYRYLDCVIAAEQKEVEDFFSHMVPRSKVRDALNALLATRALSFIPVGSRSMVQVAPEPVQPSRRHA